MKAGSRSTWLSLLLVAFVALTFSAGAAYAQSDTFQWEGIVQAINTDGSLVVIPTQGGQPTGAAVTIGTANGYVASQLEPGDLVLFEVAQTSDGHLIADDFSIEQSNYQGSPSAEQQGNYEGVPAPVDPAPPVASNPDDGAPAYGSPYNYGYYPYGYPVIAPGFSLQFGVPYYYGTPGYYTNGRGFAHPDPRFNSRGFSNNPGFSNRGFSNPGFAPPQTRSSFSNRSFSNPGFSAPRSRSFAAPGNRSFASSPGRGAPAVRSNPGFRGSGGGQSRGGSSHGNHR